MAERTGNVQISPPGPRAARPPHSRGHEEASSFIVSFQRVQMTDGERRPPRTLSAWRAPESCQVWLGSNQRSLFQPRSQDHKRQIGSQLCSVSCWSKELFSLEGIAGSLTPGISQLLHLSPCIRARGEVSGTHGSFTLGEVEIKNSLHHKLFRRDPGAKISLVS